jgi:hypothetical protein
VCHPSVDRRAPARQPPCLAPGARPVPPLGSRR